MLTNTAVIELSDDIDIELNSIQGQKSNGRFGQETEAEKEARVRLLFAANPTIVRLGNLLSVKAKDGVTLAEHLAAGRAVPVPAVKLNDGSKIAPSNVRFMSLDAESLKLWGCVSCHSAHGSGVGNSDKINVKRLLTVKFFYALEEKILFTISSTCYDKYVDGSVELKRQIVDRVTPKTEAAPKPEVKPAEVKAPKPEVKPAEVKAPKPEVKGDKK